MFRALAGTVNVASPVIARTASFIGRSFAYIFILPTYRLVTLFRLRYARVSTPVRGWAITIFTHRYLPHAIIVTMSVLTIGTNVLAGQTSAQDAGQTSLLYEIVAGDDTRTTEEGAGANLLVQDSRYANDSIIVAPDIDFDYEETAELPITSPSVPGTIVANLIPHEADQPTGPAEERTETVNYIVQNGDTLSTIAQRFGVNIGTLLWSNGRTATQYIRPGDTLRIPPVSGVLVTVKSGETLSSLAKKYGSDIDDIVRVNRLDPEKPLAAGVEIVLPGGTPPAQAVAARVTTPTSKSTNSLEANAAKAARFNKPDDADTSSAPATKLLWPTSGHVITQYYGWRHTGLDLDGDYDSPLYASHDGVVTTAGWNSGGYGLQILVDGDGVRTRYAHAPKIFVKSGDTVKRGQTIAMMGTTGRSTGTHLHYEVYINGKRVNPLTYIR
jgi:murein DD-endopeptidase MepM/ murein hydrolase activator NlpD